MYDEAAVKIMKAENGYVVKICVPIKEEPSKDKGTGCCLSPYKEGEAKFVAKNFDEVLSTLKELLPKLEMDYTTEKAFDAAFKEAANGKK